jgi:chromosome segregation ATPase
MLALVAAAFLAAGSAAYAQSTVEQLRAQRDSLLGRLEINLQLKQSIQTRASQLEARVTHLTSEMETLDAEIAQSNTYCRGEFEEAEYQRRTAACTTWQGGLNGRARDLGFEAQNLQRQYSDLQQQDEARVREATSLLQQLDVVASQACNEVNNERMVECARQFFDQSVYHPNRADAVAVPNTIVVPNGPE